MRKGKKHDIETEFQGDWRLPEKYKNYAEGKGFDQERIDLEFEHFCIHWQETGIKRPGWYKSWQKWILNSLKWNGNNSPNRNGQSKPAVNPFLVAAAKIIDDDLNI